MRPSALELELRDRIHRASSAAERHDRGVLVGLLLSLVPLPPVSLVGFVLSALNLQLIRRGKLPVSERRLSLIALGCAGASFLLGGALCTAVGWIVLHGWSFLPTPTMLPDFLWRSVPHGGGAMRPLPDMRQL